MKLSGMAVLLFFMLSTSAKCYCRKERESARTRLQGEGRETEYFILSHFCGLLLILLWLLKLLTYLQPGRICHCLQKLPLMNLRSSITLRLQSLQKLKQFENVNMIGEKYEKRSIFGTMACVV